MISLMTIPFSGVHADQTATLAGGRHRAKDRCVINQKDSGIGHEHFETRYAFVHRRVQLFNLAVFQFRSDQMKAVVDRRFAFGLLVPVINALNKRLAFVLNSKVNDGCCAAMGRGARAGEKIVGGLRAAERKLMCVCGSIPPGMTSFPAASITLSTSISSFAPITETTSPSISMSAL